MKRAPASLEIRILGSSAFGTGSSRRASAGAPFRRLAERSFTRATTSRILNRANGVYFARRAARTFQAVSRNSACRAYTLVRDNFQPTIVALCSHDMSFSAFFVTQVLPQISSFWRCRVQRPNFGKSKLSHHLFSNISLIYLWCALFLHSLEWGFTRREERSASHSNSSELSAL